MLEIKDGIKGKFITFEGVEGSGKSTQSKMLYDYLINNGIEVILTREIGGSVIAEKIRELVLHNEMLPISELMLIIAARNEHLFNKIIPALNQGITVICDRFIDSTIAYQGINPDIGMYKILLLHKELCNNIMPDYTILINLPASEGLQRAKNRNFNNNKFESKELIFHNKVYNKFIELSNLFKERIITINAINLTPKELHYKILDNINSIFS